MLTQKEQDIIDDLLQHNVCIRHKNKIIRKGIFTLYSVKDFLITIILKNFENNTTRSYEIYKPYRITQSDNSVTFDYTLKSLCNEKKYLNIVEMFKDKKNKHKFYDSKITVEIQQCDDYNNNDAQV